MGFGARCGYPGVANGGLGSALIDEGLSRAREEGVGFVLVLGEPAYYPHFGFDARLATAIEAPLSGPYLMGLQLSKWSPAKGRAHYPPAFGA